MGYDHRIQRLLVTYYLCVWLLCPSGAFMHAGVELRAAPRLRKGCNKHAARLPLGSASSIVEAAMAVKTKKEGSVARGSIFDNRLAARRLEDLKVGDRLKGIVVGELEGETGKKAWVRFGVRRVKKSGRSAYVDGMIRVNRQKGIKPARMAVDKPVTVYVSKVIAAEGRLEVSLRPPKVRKPVVDTSNLLPLFDLAVGDELQGTVKTVTHVAAFISCGVGRPTRRLRPDGKPVVMEEVDGFLGKDDIPEGTALSAQLVKKETTEVVIREGDVLKVIVKAVHPSNGRFRLTLDPDLSEDKVRRRRSTGTRARGRFSRRKEAADLVAGEEIVGDVVKTFEYGFLVDIGAKANGLVHISSISDKEDRYLGSLRDFASEGDRMRVRVNGLDEKGRLSLSYVARERDQPKPPNRRERRAAAQMGQTTIAASNERTLSAFDDEATVEAREARDTITIGVEEEDDGDDDDDGGFLFDSPPRHGGVDEDQGGYTSNLDYDIFDEM